MKKTFSIQGMHCASCVGRIEGALKKTNGVKKGTVNLATEKATVEFEPDKISEEQIRQTISEAGYQAILDEGANVDEDEKRKKKEMERLRLKVVISLFLGGLIFWGSFPGLMETSPREKKFRWTA